MVEVNLEINEVQDGDSCDFETYLGSIDTNDLLGAEILEVIGHKYDDGHNEVDELKIRLKDGRIIRVCGDNMELLQWSDDVEVSKDEEAALERAGLARADALAAEILSGRGWER